MPLQALPDMLAELRHSQEEIMEQLKNARIWQQEQFEDLKQTLTTAKVACSTSESSSSKRMSQLLVEGEPAQWADFPGFLASRKTA